MVEKIGRLQFRESRDKFQQIKNKILDYKFKEEIAEFEKALNKLILEYDTANWENRFVVGGALELLFCALLNSIGFKTEWIKEARYDIKIDNIPFSLKSNFVSSGDIRLVNILGNERVAWQEPTIFFISEMGICYADPAMELKTKHTNEALTINVEEIQSMVSKKDSVWQIKISIPKKPKNSQKIKTASSDVVKSILINIKSKFLINNLPKE